MGYVKIPSKVNGKLLQWVFPVTKEEEGKGTVSVVLPRKH